MKKIYAAKTIAKEVRTIYKKVLSHANNNYLPSPELNKLFSQLVAISTSYPHKEITDTVLSDLESDATLSSFRAIQGIAESHLEKFWAERLLASNNPRELLKEYPYTSGYELLVRGEYASLSQKLGHPLQRCIFFGSGPLPFSALILAMEYGVHCRCIDRDSYSATLSQQLIQHFRLQELITIEACDMHDVHTIENDEAIILAALVGLDSHDKNSAIAHCVEIAPHALLCCRSVRDLGALHYVPITSDNINPHYTPSEIVHPYPCVNTSVICVPA